MATLSAPLRAPLRARQGRARHSQRQISTCPPVKSERGSVRGGGRKKEDAADFARHDSTASVGARASERRLARASERRLAHVQAKGGGRPCCGLSLQAGYVEQSAAARSCSRSCSRPLRGRSLRCGAGSARRGVQFVGARLALPGLVGSPQAHRGVLRHRPPPLSPQAAWGRQGGGRRGARPLEAVDEAEAHDGWGRPQPGRPPSDPHAPKDCGADGGASTSRGAQGRAARGCLLAREQDVACWRRECARGSAPLRGAVRHAR